jgi:signal transduction histidine kinase
MAELAILDRLLLRADGPLTPKQEELARRAYRQALEMNRMTENARLLLRLREAGTSAPAEDVDARAVLRKTLETVRMMHFDRPFDVETSGIESLAAMRGSPLLESLLLNLLDNAVRHTGRGKRPSIEVRAAEVEGALSLSVRGGDAADPERLRALLDPRQAGRKAGGHGLGLTLVKEIVEREGGAVRVGTAGERFEVELLIPRK